MTKKLNSDSGEGLPHRPDINGQVSPGRADFSKASAELVLEPHLFKQGYLLCLVNAFS